MAFDFLLDQKTNDLVIEDKELKFTTELPQELSQRLGIRLRTFQNEWFIDQDFGVPYMQQIISQTRRKEDVDIIMISEIREEEGVNTVKDFDSTWERDTRVYTFNANITTDSGEIPVAILTQPSTEWIYPDNGDDNSRVDCGILDLQFAANRLFYFINYEGLPDQTYATWINQWK